MTSIRVPRELLPGDGRFGCGPSKVRPEALAALAATGTSYLGTSHRQDGVRAVVRRVRAGMSELFSLPDGYEVVLGNGGTTTFWDAACFGLIERRSQHCVFGEFSGKFADAVAATPFLDPPSVLRADPGTVALPVPEDGIDFYALTHNETSTGAMQPVRRPAPESFVAVDATSGAGGLLVDVRECDVYYFAPQKGFGSDAGLWVALLSPAAVARIGAIGSGDRWIPPSMDLSIALEQSRLDQTYNTPALATIFLIAEQVEWLLSIGGLPGAAARCAQSAEVLYGWAEASPYATPFVKDPEQRSRVVGTIDFDPSVDAAALAATLRANGILDTEPYRKLGRNQLRIGMFPVVDADDVRALTACIDFVVEASERS